MKLSEMVGVTFLVIFAFILFFVMPLAIYSELNERFGWVIATFGVMIYVGLFSYKRR